MVPRATIQDPVEVIGSRREAMIGALAAGLALAAPASAKGPAGSVPVGEYLPPAGDGLVLYKPDAQKTPVCSGVCGDGRGLFHPPLLP